MNSHGSDFFACAGWSRRVLEQPAVSGGKSLRCGRGEGAAKPKFRGPLRQQISARGYVACTGTFRALLAGDLVNSTVSTPLS